MKKLSLLLLTLTLCFFTACHKDIWAELENLDQRVTKLEELCKEMNTNITSLQTIVSVLQANDYITSIVEIKKNGEVIGYTITFGKHDPITIYHGEDGKDGSDGKDGQDGANGSTPVIGVARDTDGVYYWTLNGEWLLDDNGNKLPVSGTNGQDGTDGKDGQDGVTPLLKIEDDYWYVSYDNGTTWTLMGKATGADGQDGTDGKDGVIPLLKIENGYWYISYDNGATWAQLGKATGEDGKDGQNGTNGTDGKDGQDGANGSNGKDGITPLLKIEDGYWYVSYDKGTTWTQFGKATGADGQNGTNGKDGQDGVTPQLKIEDGYWYISYDKGATWTQLGKATGEDGKDGQNGSNGTNGKDGQDGDSMFQSVTQDDDYVYFTLADGTVIKIAKGKPSTEEQPNSEFMFIVTYDANGGEGVMQPDTFYYGVLKTLSNNKFTKPSHEFVNWNTKADGSGIAYEEGLTMMISKNITLYAQWKMKSTSGVENGYEWVDLGLSVKWATCNIGATKEEQAGDYYRWGEIELITDYIHYKWYQNETRWLIKYNEDETQGIVDNKTTLELSDDVAAVKWGGTWRMPTENEIDELCNNCTWTWITKNQVNGCKIEGPNGNCIFLPATGYHNYSPEKIEKYNEGLCGAYWSSSLLTSLFARSLWCNSEGASKSFDLRSCSLTIRPVCPK